MNPRFRSRDVVLYAILSRLALIGIVAISTFFISSLPYDTSATLVFPASSAANTTSSDGTSIEEAWEPSSIGRLLTRLTSWDALYFTTIAREGYLWEHYHAFFPGFPVAMKLFSDGLFLAGYSLPPGDLLLISGFIFNSAAFVLCAVVLYHLALAAMRHEELAFRTSLLFCFSPANPFFLALYTESTFALTSFAGIYCALYGTGGPLQRVSWTMLSALLFALSTTIRSNGMILVGFLIYMAVARAWSALRRRQYIQTFGELVLGGVSAVVAIVPLLLYLYSSYERYCTNGVSRPWCDATVPNIYSFVQNFYWNVGFLNYYRIHQIPNFLLAAPVIILSISAIYTFVKSDWPNTWTLGLNSTAARVEGIRNRSSASPSSLLSGFYNPENFVHLAHLFALLISALPFIHIQVITRFLLSQCPILYCYLAEVISASSTPLRAKQALLLYIVVFNVLGMILFANFLPWT